MNQQEYPSIPEQRELLENVQRKLSNQLFESGGLFQLLPKNKSIDPLDAATTLWMPTQVGVRHPDGKVEHELSLLGIMPSRHGRLLPVRTALGCIDPETHFFYPYPSVAVEPAELVVASAEWLMELKENGKLPNLMFHLDRIHDPSTAITRKPQPNE
jgi:hypothetical protein